MKSMKYILIHIFIYIAVDMTQQVVGSIGASTSRNTPIDINRNHVPPGMTFQIGACEGFTILPALNEPGNLAQHIVIGNRNIGLVHVIQNLNPTFTHFLRAQKMIVDAASLGFDKIRQERADSLLAVPVHDLFHLVVIATADDRHDAAPDPVFLEQLLSLVNGRAMPAHDIMYLRGAVATHGKINPQFVQFQHAFLRQQSAIGCNGKLYFLGVFNGELPCEANHLFDPVVRHEQRLSAVHVEPQGRKAGVLNQQARRLFSRLQRHFHGSAG
jgi:hypothetical protein